MQVTWSCASTVAVVMKDASDYSKPLRCDRCVFIVSVWPKLFRCFLLHFRSVALTGLALVCSRFQSRCTLLKLSIFCGSWIKYKDWVRTAQWTHPNSVIKTSQLMLSAACPAFCWQNAELCLSPAWRQLTWLAGPRCIYWPCCFYLLYLVLPDFLVVL